MAEINFCEGLKELPLHGYLTSAICYFPESVDINMGHVKRMHQKGSPLLAILSKKEKSRRL